MTKMTVCDVCGNEIVPGDRPIEFAGGDYHDRPECIGAIQAAWDAAVAKVKKPAVPK